MAWSLAWLLFLPLVTACWPQGVASSTPPPARSETIAPTIGASTATPGLVIHGHIRLGDGSHLPNVTICLSFASYSGRVVALSDQAGNFQTGFVSIPGDETIGVWARLAGYTFEPSLVNWRHYHGYEERTLDFVGIPTLAAHIPPASCP